MSAQEIADGLVSLCREGRFKEAVDAFYSDDIVSVEAQGEPRELRGIDACRGKEQWFNATYEVLDCQVEGPWLNDPCFIAKFIIKVRNKETERNPPWMSLPYTPFTRARSFTNVSSDVDLDSRCMIRAFGVLHLD